MTHVCIKRKPTSVQYQPITYWTSQRAPKNLNTFCNWIEWVFIPYFANMYNCNCSAGYSVLEALFSKIKCQVSLIQLYPNTLQFINIWSICMQLVTMIMSCDIKIHHFRSKLTRSCLPTIYKIKMKNSWFFVCSLLTAEYQSTWKKLSLYNTFSAI